MAVANWWAAAIGSESVRCIRCVALLALLQYAPQQPFLEGLKIEDEEAGHGDQARASGSMPARLKTGRSLAMLLRAGSAARNAAHWGCTWLGR